MIQTVSKASLYDKSITFYYFIPKFKAYWPTREKPRSLTCLGIVCPTLTMHVCNLETMNFKSLCSLDTSLSLKSGLAFNGNKTII
jgi:hypothetical protein